MHARLFRLIHYLEKEGSIEYSSEWDEDGEHYKLDFTAFLSKEPWKIPTPVGEEKLTLKTYNMEITESDLFYYPFPASDDLSFIVCETVSSDGGVIEIEKILMVYFHKGGFFGKKKYWLVAIENVEVH